jgi:hypothetical protein
MKVLTGHLTATNKKHIKAILEADLLKARINTIDYFLSLKNDIYTVKTAQKDRGFGFIGNEFRITIYTATFKL